MKKITKNKEGKIVIIEEFNKDNKLIYKKFFISDNVTDEEWYEYDENGRNVGYRNSYGTKKVRKFGVGNEIIYAKVEHNDFSKEQWKTFNKFNKIIYQKTIIIRLGSNTELYEPNVREITYDYDENNNLIHSYDSVSGHKWCDYDPKGRLVCVRNESGIHSTYEYED